MALDDLEAERGERLLVEAGASPKVSDNDPDMIEHCYGASALNRARKRFSAFAALHGVK